MSVARPGTLFLAVLVAAVIGGAALPGLARGSEKSRPAVKSVSLSPEAQGRVVIVVIDRIGLDDVTGTTAPNLLRLIGGGSISLMNARIKNDAFGLGSYVVIGAGGRALGGDNVGLAFNSDESLQNAEGVSLTASSLYLSRTGRTAPPGSVVNISIEEMKKASDTNLASGTPGLLGQALKKAQMSIAVVGNADSETPAVIDQSALVVQGLYSSYPPGARANTIQMVATTHREVSCIAMDEAGVVPSGDVSADLWRNIPGGPGITTDFSRLADEAVANSNADLLVVDMVQTSRVDEQSDFYTAGKLDVARKQALLECDPALGRIMDTLDFARDLMIVCTPTPTRKMIAEGDFLTPLIVAGHGFKPGSYLGSPTTRRKGLVSNFDIAPTVIDFLGLKVPTEMEGAVFSSSGTGAEFTSLASLQDRALRAANTRAALLNTFFFPGSLILLILLLLSFFRVELIRDHRYFWSMLLLSVLSAPLVFLLVPLMNIDSTAWAILVAIVVAAAIGTVPFLALLRAQQGARGDSKDSWDGGVKPDGKAASIEYALSRSILIISGLTLIGVLLDPIIGGPMIAFSPFGAGPIAGGRYYGIGNIYLGIALGAAMLVGCLILDVYPRSFKNKRNALLLVGVILLITVFVVGYPRLGANVGGLITGLFAVLFVLAKLLGVRIGWKQVLLIVAIVIVGLALLFVVDLVLPGPASHAGREAVRVGGGGGVREVVKLAIRKQTLNWKLLWTSSWRWFVAISILCALVWYKTLSMFDTVKRRFSHMPAAWLGILVGVIAGIIFKDTGVEAAGGLMLYFTIPTLLLFLGLWNVKEPSNASIRNDVGSAR